MYELSIHVRITVICRKLQTGLTLESGHRMSYCGFLANQGKIRNELLR